MRKIALVASVIGAVTVGRIAQAQQVAAVTSCSLGVDGGTTTSTLTCPSVTANFQPVILECEYTTAGSHLVASTTLQASVDGTHFGPIEDGGVTLYVNQDVNTTTTLSSPLVLSAGVNNSYQYVQPVTSVTINDGGTAGNAVVNCQTSVLQSQTIKGVRKKASASP